jgi:hypothetical protein
LPEEVLSLSLSLALHFSRVIMHITSVKISLTEGWASLLLSGARLIHRVDEAICAQSLHDCCVVIHKIVHNIAGKHKERDLQRVRHNCILVEPKLSIGCGPKQNDVIGSGNPLGGWGRELQVDAQRAIRSAQASSVV